MTLVQNPNWMDTPTFTAEEWAKYGTYHWLAFTNAAGEQDAHIWRGISSVLDYLGTMSARMADSDYQPERGLPLPLSIEQLRLDSET